MFSLAHQFWLELVSYSVKKLVEFVTILTLFIMFGSLCDELFQRVVIVMIIRNVYVNCGSMIGHKLQSPAQARAHIGP